MDFNEEEIKAERERKNAEIRSAILEEERGKERGREKKKERERIRKENSFSSRLKRILTSSKLTDLSKLELTDFPSLDEQSSSKGEGLDSTNQGEGKNTNNSTNSLSPNSAAEQPADTKAESVNENLTAALDAITGRFALIAFTCLDDVDAESMLKVGLSVLSTAIYPLKAVAEDMQPAYVAILNDCWQNKNALNKMTADLEEEFKRSTGKDLITVCLGASESDAAGRLKRTMNALYRKIRDLTEPLDNSNLDGLTHRLKQQIEANAIEQARRQFERQLEEDGEIDEDIPVVIREAKNMSEDEYDSYLSEEEQEIKYQARKNYIDDDVSIEQTLHNIEKHNTMDDPLYLIAIASVDMNTLIILEDSDDFRELCLEADVSMMRCSYIYAISKSGGHWYGNNHATRDIEDIFEALSEIIRSRGGRFKSEFLYEVPNISIFKDIYLQ